MLAMIEAVVAVGRVPQLAVNGLIFSCIIILGAIGLSLTYSISDFANFAHGDTMMIGAFVALFGSQAFTYLLPSNPTVFQLPVSLYGGLVLGMGVAALVSVATEKIIYEPLDTGAIELLITSIGVALVYRAIVQLSVGAESRSYNLDRGGRYEWVHESIGVSVTPRDVIIVLVTILLVVGLHTLLQRTNLGRKMRATADNPSLARVSGIRTREVIYMMWIIGGALAAAGGVFLGIETLVRPEMGFDVLLVIFAAVILGGIGSVYGAMLGGLAIGMAYELTPLLPHVGTEYGPAVAFVIMIGILFVRPEGIMGETQ